MSVSASRPNDKGKAETVIDELDWIQLQAEIQNAAPESEGLRERIIRKTRANPFVPLGCLLTSGVLGYGLWCMRTGQSRRSQTMMRWRIGAQGITVVALLLGVVVAASKEKPK